MSAIIETDSLTKFYGASLGINALTLSLIHI